MHGISNTQPHKQWDMDFFAAFKKWRSKGNRVTFMGDLNGGIDDTDISKLLAAAELYNVIAAHHGINSPKMRINGPHAIDLLLADKMSPAQSSMLAC
eukprot:15361487-Ditylum_brightwellii.AAC.1